MKHPAVIPSLLVFGSQTELPSQEALEDLRQELITNPLLSSLCDAVKDLPRFWETLISFDPSLGRVPGTKYLGRLQQWIVDGTSSSHPLGDIPNIYALPVTLILQVTQYIRYLSQVGLENSHRFILEGLQDGGVQGFCVGFLSALAVSCAGSDAQIAPISAVGLRLAVCIGAYVDKDGIFAEEPNRTACVAIRWRGDRISKGDVTELVRTYPDAYISSINDNACVTVTARAADVADLTEKCRARGLLVKAVHVYGRFHSKVHSSSVHKLTKFAMRSEDIQFPNVDSLQIPVRSTVNGEIIVDGLKSLSRLALESILLEPADWHKTLEAATFQLRQTHKVVASAGFGSHFPPSLIQTSALQVLSLNDLEGTNSKRSVEPSMIHGFTNNESVNGTHKSTNGVSTTTNGEHKPSNGTLPTEQAGESQYPSHSIAIVGMSGRFPGADNLDELWELLLSAGVMAKRAPTERLKLPGPKPGDQSGTQWWGNFLNDPDAFDHRFFGKSSREAIAWDPQQRILLEVVYEALESTGYFGATSTSEPDDYGCYIGAATNAYYDNLSSHQATAYATPGTSRCFLSGVVSHYFGWTGPSLAIDTACSSSLVAINTACRAIWSGECSRAVAGGTNVFTSPFDYRNLCAAGFLSPTGQCKPFDASGDGYCRGEGVGVVVLKPLATAIKENDNILGVIVGSATNQNKNCSHITVPHSPSQLNLYQKVMNMASVKPESVTYVEAHGTGTGVGDPIECQSIRDAFGGSSRDSTLYFSSIKGNIGHTEATAGVAGLIKVLLMMQHGEIPPQASYSKLNPKIPSLEPDLMEIPREIQSWNPSVRLACVNSYGAAGSNSALMIRQKPVKPVHSFSDSQDAVTSLSKYPLFISAASANSLSMYCRKLLDWIKHSKKTAQILTSNLAFNLADRANHSLPHIISAAVTDISSFEEKLASAASGEGIVTVPDSKPVILVFGGQESDFIGLSEEVYQSSSLLRHHLDDCNKNLLSLGFESLYPAIFQQTPVSNLVTLHSALFSIQYASAKAWMDCGLAVSAVVGHSFGQLTALCISGVLSLPDTLKLVAGRATVMTRYWGSEPGSMIFLQAGWQKVSEILDSLKSQGVDAEIACYNGPESHVVVGSTDAINTVEKFIASSPSLRDLVRVKRLRVTHGFHSKLSDPLLPHLTALAKELTWRRPQIHLETCDDNQSVTEPDSRMVAEHMRHPVFFQQAVERLTQQYSQSTWLEAGRGSSVIQLVRGSIAETQGHLFLSPKITISNAQDSITDITLNLWNAGYSVQYWPFHRTQKSQYQYLRLPPYQFEKNQHWLPFTGQVGEKELLPGPVQELPTVHEFLSFIHFKDESRKEAVFRVSPQSDRFKSLLSGHVMSGQSLAPASLYFEVAARAALYLQSDTLAAASYVPMVEDLVMKAPIGLVTNRDIFLSLKSMHGSRLSWSFSVTTQAQPSAAGGISHPVEQSTGTVSLNMRNDTQAARRFGRFETLTGYRRYEEIMSHPGAEKMQGNHIYRAFNQLVHYGENFQGMKNLACVGTEVAGNVVISVDASDPPDQRLCDTPMTDSFMQPAGVLVNYFNNPSLEDVFVCNEIERIEIGGSFNPDAKEWIVYANMTEDGKAQVSADAYIFEAESKRMIMAAFGFRFSKMSQSLLARLLKGANRSSPSGNSVENMANQTNEKPLEESFESLVIPAKKSLSKRAELRQIFHSVTDIPLEDLKDESTLEDLGVDSLMATEVLNDIREVLGLTIDLTSFLFFPNFQAILAHVDSKLGLGGHESDYSEAETPITELGTPAAVVDTPATEVDVPNISGVSVGSNFFPKKSAPIEPVEPSNRPSIASAYDSFKEIRLGYNQIAVGTGAVSFWARTYPDQARLVRAYIVEAYAKLGCDLRTLHPGDTVPKVKSLDRHEKLVNQLYRILEDGGLISAATGKFVRTEVALDSTPSEVLYEKILSLYPQHANIHKLVQVIGSQLAACLVGEQDALQLVFGSGQNKQTLEDIYENWPLFRTPTLLLGDFLTKAFSNSSGTGKFRILEIGAGTGGTTRYLIKHLQSHGIPFDYTFTDISASLVAAARKQFKGVAGMSFEVLDIEKPPVEEHKEAFHVIIASNCIHATRRLDQSLLHLRKMLREDGALTLIEITKNMCWLDLVFGQFEGWWLFEDGRSHALVSETQWGSSMKNAGFKAVLWTDGDAPEAKSVRVIGGFPSAPTMSRIASKDTDKKSTKAVVETVVYKKVGNTEIHADVYYPASSSLSAKNMPIALMIHGGSHIMFTRKDVRPPQTRILLEKGFIPVALDHRLCPEVSLSEGPMVDVCDALEWARYKLPHIKLKRSDLQIDGERVVVVGWSSGGQLAMSLAWTAPQRGLRPPEAILAFYCPTNYEDEWWRHPIQPRGAEDKGYKYDVLEAVQDEPVTNYGLVGAWEPLSDPRILTDARCRIVLHINWKAQTLPVITGGLPSRKKAAKLGVRDWMALPQPGLDKLIPISPLAQIVRGKYRTPTFLVHGTADDLIPWQQSQVTYNALLEQGIASHLELVPDAPHVCDLSSDTESDGWKAVINGYEFLSSYVF